MKPSGYQHFVERYEEIFERMAPNPAVRAALDPLRLGIHRNLLNSGNGNLSKWAEAVASAPQATGVRFGSSAGKVVIGGADQLDPKGLTAMRKTLEALAPWRKGPFQWFGIDMDTEWRSDKKWDRLKPHLSDLTGKVVLDVGCGNGYYGWRMLEAGARWVLGLDPSLLFTMQNQLALQYGENLYPNYVVPLGAESLEGVSLRFDTVFSMGVLYHRRSPMDHLLRHREWLREGGEFVLETLIVDGEDGYCLVPRDRYAKMRNVWFLPSPLTLEAWMRRCGFKNVQLVDRTRTTTQEQRSTPWMRFESLDSFLDPADPSLTIEGYPAPERGLFVATV